MKTSTIRKLAAIYGTTVFVPHATIPLTCSILETLPVAEEGFEYRKPKKLLKKRRFLRMYTPKTKSSSKKNTSKIEISKEYSKDISLRNFNIISNRFKHKITYWQLYLLLKEKALNNLWILLQENPDDKILLAQFKKAEHSYNDSMDAFYNFHNSYSSLRYNIPIGAIPYGFKSSDNSAKLIKQDTLKDYEKKRTKHIRKSRKNKMLERDFWLNQWETFEEFDSSEQPTMETKKSPNEELFEDFCKAHADFIKALLALNSECVEDAAWAIHDGTEEQFADSIKKAKELFKTYEKALDRYEIFLSFMQCPEEY